MKQRSMEAGRGAGAAGGLTEPTYSAAVAARETGAEGNCVIA